MYFYYYINLMARPPKDPSDRKSADLRIPVTEEQKDLIAKAAAAMQSDVATWIRPILLEAARMQLSKRRMPKMSRAGT